MNIIKLLESLYGTTCNGVREAPVFMVGAFFILTNSLNAIGAMYLEEITELITCATNETSRFCTLSLPKGSYVIIANAVVSGVTKEGNITISIGNASYTGRTGVILVPNKAQYLSVTAFKYVATDNKYNEVDIAIWQNSGADVTATGKIYALKIK